ncbi:MAG: sensor histidine kinase [Gammaproteobacteria bacterium]
MRWRLLELLNIYRILVAGATIIVSVAPPIAHVLQMASPETVRVAGIAYLVFGLIAIHTLARERPNLWIQSQFEPIADLLAGAIIMQATGANLGILAAMLVPPAVVSAAAAKSRVRSVFFAALAALTVLAAAVGSQLSLSLPIAIYTQAGLFGLGILAIALISNTLAVTLLDKESLALTRGRALRQANAVNRHIVAQLATGVIVTDSTGGIVRANPAARNLLDPAGRTAAIRLAATGTGREGHQLHLANGETRLLTTQPLGSDATNGRLIFIEDIRTANEQAQSLKLAALGRLAAGMAHQIRNPLSAILHANQMLVETRGLDERTRHLIGIVSRQGERLNAMVNDILDLSRPDTVQAQTLEVITWLEGFLADYRERQPRHARQLKVTLGNERINTRFELGHLEHIVGNLLDNAFHHADTPAGVELSAGKREGRAFLEVRDRGPGLNEPERVFEPFFTTHSAGTGLGLYIARELASANHAILTAENRNGGGSCFRLEFARESAWLK